MTAAIATVSVTSDTRSLLGAMAATFSRGTTVLSELLQNARRAKSPSVEILATDEQVSITDLGGGIEDFSVLLAMAKSGWDESVQREDSPYGLGFISGLFACKTLRVESCGQRMEAATADLIELKMAQVIAADTGPGTTITLIGHRLGKVNELRNSLTRMVAGFPIPVRFNGEELERPDAIDCGDFVDFGAGKVSTRVLGGEHVSRFYLQGLPITMPMHRSRHFSHYNHSHHAIHLDPAQFFGRMPDRDTVIEPEAAAARIDAALNTIITEYLTQRAADMTPEEFIKRYADFAAKMDMQDVLNAIPLVPSTWLNEYDGTPVLEGSSTWSPLSKQSLPDVLTREQVEARRVFVTSNDCEEGESLVAEHAVSETKSLVLDGSRVPSWHWLRTMARDLAPEDFELQPGVEVGSGSLEVYGYDVTLRVVETLHLKVVAEGTGLPELIPVAVIYDPGTCTLYATSDAESDAAVMQVSVFEDDERFEEDRRDEASSAFWAMRETIQSNDPSTLVSSFLRRSLPFVIPEQLKGKTFTVAFDEAGKLEVAAAP